MQLTFFKQQQQFLNLNLTVQLASLRLNRGEQPPAHFISSFQPSNQGQRFLHDWIIKWPLVFKNSYLDIFNIMHLFIWPRHSSSLNQATP